MCQIELKDQPDITISPKQIVIRTLTHQMVLKQLLYLYFYSVFETRHTIIVPAALIYFAKMDGQKLTILTKGLKIVYFSEK